ncbi:Spore protein YkvP [Jeotgalicoccus saudimassiliensis]|uniref:Spore protein YkvP n=1 Tax=Jeotgalicoccus saudimassiliensis TaxID=1461582 RepID=A0A078LWX1_9STAP|nr:glycosyltransferase [Jeotgalicoccus saudimassiliensis]CDZ99658.1 Spore protein YkvP [Jeotgalicoccus saudimassiliensis]
MNKQSVVEQFNDYFINKNRVKHIEDLSYNLPLSDITGINKNNIIIGRTSISIPEHILENSTGNKTILDAFTNSKNEIYYVDSEYKKYYRIGYDIEVENYSLRENEILKFEFNYDNHDDINCHFIVIEFSTEKGILARKYSNLNDVRILPNKETNYLRAFIVPENKGFFYNLEMNVVKENMTVLSNTFLELNTDVMYNPDTRVTMKKDNDNLLISVPELNKNFIYFSYGIQNNSFNKLPEQSLININTKNLYKLITPFKLHDEIDFTPTVIEYNNTGKTNLIKLTNESEFIRFQKDTTAIRLSYRFTGTGKVEIQPINIIEYETETEYEIVEWNSRYEIDTHMKTIKSIKDLRMAVIMDEFTYHSYKYEADLLRLTFDNWKNEINSFMPHFIFIESSWHGNNGDWSKKIAYVTDEKHSYIKDLIAFAQSLNIPVVFWNKEDPVHYDHFIHTAKLCDYIFTTDQDRVDDYKAACNHENVDVLQFAAQPVNHNPLKIQKERVDGISFAGSYYGLREERSKDMNRLFKASIPHNLYIYDRNYEYTKKGERLNFLFPEEFRKYILGTLPFYEIEKAYKGYKYMININTVKTSPTMYARRVYEGLASGTPIISNYSLGMEKQFGDIIGYSENTDELNDYLAKLNNSPSEYNKVKQLGVRKVLSEHTYEQRLLQIADTLGYEFTLEEKTVTFITFIDNKDEISSIVDQFESIIYSNKQLIIAVTDEINDYSIINKNISILNEKRLTENFETLSKLAETHYISLLSQNDYYAPNYLKDLMLAVQYTDASVIGKSNYFVSKNYNLDEVNENSEHEYTENINMNSAIIRSSLFSNFNLEETFNYLKGNKDITELNYLGFKIYSNDKMNYIKNGNEISDNQKYNVLV